MQGNKQLCEQISSWYKKNDHNIPAENIMITSGSGPATATCTQLFSSNGDTIVADGPAYFLSFYTFRDAQLDILQVPTNEGGLDLDALESLLLSGQKIKLVYTVPFANNPTGVTMSDEGKQRLVQLAQTYDFTIISDEVYQLLLFQDDLPKSLFCFDKPDDPRVLAINSFSKLLGPGLRIGWISAHKPLISRILNCGALQSGGGFNPFTSALVSEIMATGDVEKQTLQVRNYYRDSCQVLCDAVEQHIRPIQNEMVYYKPTGGFFLFLRLHEDIDTAKLLEIAQKQGVSFFAGCHSSVDKKQYTNCVRLCFAFLPPPEIVEGVKRLATAIREYHT